MEALTHSFNITDHGLREFILPIYTPSYIYHGDSAQRTVWYDATREFNVD